MFGHAEGMLEGESVAIVFPGRSESGRSRFLRESADDAGTDSMGERETRDRMFGQAGRVQAVTADGTELTVHLGTTAVGADSEFVLICVQDMTNWVWAERELEDARHRRTLAEDHERIGRELHDTVIQELFAAGMTLQVLEQGLAPETAGRVAEVVDALDATISRIRSVIFGLRKPVEVSRGLRRRLTDMVAGLTDALGFEPHCRLEGPLDTQLPDATVDQVLAVAREALTNVAKHADASGAELLVHLGDDLLVEVVDDGTGMAEGVGRRSGHANLAQRAERMGGHFEVSSGHGEGTTIRWRVPVEPT